MSSLKKIHRHVIQLRFNCSIIVETDSDKDMRPFPSEQKLLKTNLFGVKVIP